MAKKKKNVEPIVISDTELIPTTIGSFETKQNGPIFAFIWILIFILAIFGLPYITALIENQEFPIFSKTNPKEENPTTPDNPLVTPEQPEYYEIKEDLIIELEGYRFYNWNLNANRKTLNLQLERTTGVANFFVNHNYYIEMYNGENTLLQRVKIPNKEIADVNNLSFDVTEAIANGVISKVSIVLIEEKDYPQVSLSSNANNEPILKCEKNNQTIIYSFKEENDVYLLKKMTETITSSSKETDYEKLLEDYTNLAATYKLLNGVNSTLTPISSGFYFETTIDLEKLPSADQKRIFKGEVYYEKDTEARVIAFELDTSGYSCN